MNFLKRYSWWNSWIYNPYIWFFYQYWNKENNDRLFIFFAFLNRWLKVQNKSQFVRILKVNCVFAIFFSTLKFAKKKSCYLISILTRPQNFCIIAAIEIFRLRFWGNVWIEIARLYILSITWNMKVDANFIGIRYNIN